ncbi:MAG: DNA polymerase I [Christensenellales bacterium]
MKTRTGPKDVQTLCQTHGLLAPDQATNACTMLQLYRKMEAGLQLWRGFEVYQTLELPLWRVLFDMECTGFRLDLAQLHDLAQQYAARIKELEKEIYNLAGEQFNINSTKQLGEVLFDKLHLPAWKKTKTGYSTDVEVLEQLKEQHPIIACILEYRKATKLKSTYLDGLQAVSDQSNGRVHTRFHQNITLTGRISSSEPNLQNIPVRTEEGREIRRAFIPSDEGRALVVADYSQIELRILAHMAKEDTMIDTFRHGGDIHTATAAKVYGVDKESVTKDMRSSAKAVNFGIVYGISDFGLSRNLSIPRKQAAALIQSYFETYPKIRGYMDQCVADGRAHGYVETMYGRRRYTPELASKNYNVRSFGERAAMNAPIQGTAADIIKAAMIHVHEALKKECPQAKLILQVHDELIVDVPRDQAEKVKKILTDCMQNVLPLDVPLIAEADSGENWLEAK